MNWLNIVLSSPHVFRATFSLETIRERSTEVILMNRALQKAMNDIACGKYNCRDAYINFNIDETTLIYRIKKKEDWLWFRNHLNTQVDRFLLIKNKRCLIYRLNYAQMRAFAYQLAEIYLGRQIDMQEWIGWRILMNFSIFIGIHTKKYYIRISCLGHLPL